MPSNGTGRPLLAALALLALGAVSARAQLSGDGHGAQIAAILGAVGTDPRGRAEAVAALHELGTEAVPELLECFASGLPAPDGLPPRALDPPLRALVLEALVLQPRRELTAYLERIPVDPTTQTLRVAGLEVMAEVGQDDDLELILALATVPEESSPRDPLLLALRESIRRVLGRDARAIVSLQTVIPDAAPQHQAHLLRALAETGGDRALRALSHLLDFAPQLAGQVLREIALAAEKSTPPHDQGVLESVRRLLLDDDAGLRRDAVLALGHLQDSESIAVLIDCLESEDAGVRKAALWSLRTISGLTLTATQARWRSWHAQETRWWSEQRPQLVAALRSQDVAAVADGIRRLSLQRLHRHEIAQDVAELVQSPRPELRFLAVSGLGQLGSRGTAPVLIDALADTDSTVREAACTALRKLFTSELPCEREAWIAELGSLAGRDS